jgi:predicted TIM-barrel fold metal-dependent hydrolase
MAQRFPGVFCTPDHMGGWSNDKGQGEAMTKALVALAALPNVYLKISTTSLGPYLTMKPEEQDLFRRVINAFTPRRMMWGSNYPASREGGYAAQLETGRKAAAWLPESERTWFFGDAALKLWPSLAATPAR